MINTPHGQGTNSVVVRQFNERVVLKRTPALGRSLKGGSRAATQHHAERRRSDRPRAGAPAAHQNDGQAQGRKGATRDDPLPRPSGSIFDRSAGGASIARLRAGRFRRKILKARRHECAFPAPEEALRLIGQEIATLRRAISIGQGRRHLVGIGVAIPYNLGSWRRELDIPATAAAAWNDFNLEELSRVMDVPVFAENDGNAIAVAELFRGHGRELDDFAVVYLDTAVGGGLVLAEIAAAAQPEMPRISDSCRCRHPVWQHRGKAPATTATSPKSRLGSCADPAPSAQPRRHKEKWRSGKARSVAFSSDKRMAGRLRRRTRRAAAGYIEHPRCPGHHYRWKPAPRRYRSAYGAFTGFAARRRTWRRVVHQRCEWDPGAGCRRSRGGYPAASFHLRPGHGKALRSTMSGSAKIKRSLAAPAAGSEIKNLSNGTGWMPDEAAE